MQRQDGRQRARVTGRQGYDYLEANPEAAAVFNRAMAELTQLVGAEVDRVYDLSGVRRLVDVGGGYGELLAVILTAHPDMRGVLFELTHAIDGAAARLRDAGVGNRCELVAGSFFDSVPSGGDVYLMKSVLHNWDGERSTDILRNCRRAMSDAAKLVLVERVMPERMTGSMQEQAVA